VISDKEGGILMIRVVVKDGKIDGALRQFKAQVARSGVPSELKKHKEYAKPGVKRRERIKEAIKNSRKKNKKNRSNDR
jgi:small subunit ribosomal protein S21